MWQHPLNPMLEEIGKYCMSSHLQADPRVLCLSEALTGAAYLRHMGKGSPALSHRQGQMVLLLTLLYSGHCVRLRQPPPSVEGCIWLEPVLMGLKLRGLFKKKDSDSVSPGPGVPAVICPCPP